ncbi:MAG: rod shape-determining protein MreC, partial [Patescibacteria group bacterium]
FKIRKQGESVLGPLASVAFVVVVSAFALQFDGMLRDLVFNFSAPLTVSPEYGLLSRNALIAKLTDAERELERVRYANVVADLLAEENQGLRSLVHAVPLPPSVAARVLARPPRTHYDTLVVDTGLSSGVASGDLVVFGAVALGRVASAGTNTALVELFSNPGANHDVLLGEPHSVAIAKGLGGGAFELTVPEEIAVAVGDTVRFPSTQSLTLGVVVDISSKPTDVSKTVRFASPVSYADLDFVEILTGAEQ